MYIDLPDGDHNYFRHGTTTLFAALKVAYGKVLVQCKSRHPHKEFLQFLKYIDQNVPKDLDIHLVVDNYATHKHEKNQTLDCSQARIPRSLFTDLRVLAQPSRDLVRHHHPESHPARDLQEGERPHRQHSGFHQPFNTNSHPFDWTATAESILDKITRIFALIHEDKTLQLGNPHVQTNIACLQRIPMLKAIECPRFQHSPIQIHFQNPHRPFAG